MVNLSNALMHFLTTSKVRTSDSGETAPPLGVPLSLTTRGRVHSGQTWLPGLVGVRLGGRGVGGGAAGKEEGLGVLGEGASHLLTGRDERRKLVEMVNTSAFY